MSISAWEKLCFLLSNTLLLQHPTASCILILPVAVKGLYPNEELLSIQGIFILQTEDWNHFLSFSLSSFWQSRTGVEPLRCLLLLVSKLAHCLARQLGVLVGSQINILSPASAEVEKWAFQRWAGCGASYWQCRLFRGEGGPVIHLDHQSWSRNHSEPRSPRVRNWQMAK